MIRINEVKLTLDEEIDIIPQKLSKMLRVKPEEIITYRIFRESIDARNRERIFFVYTVDVKVQNEEKILKQNQKVTKTPNLKYQDVPSGKKSLKHRPVIIGFGPAGIFAGIILAQRGYRPIILERGRDVDTRTKDVENFWKTGKLHGESNVQFGEGGAGTFLMEN